MTESGQFLLLGLFASAILWLDYKLGSFGVASDRSRNPINFWMGFGLMAAIAAISFAVAIWSLVRIQ